MNVSQKTIWKDKKEDNTLKAGVILYHYCFENYFCNILADCTVEFLKKKWMPHKPLTLGIKGVCKKPWCYQIIKSNAFNDYSSFDAFLLKIAEKCKDNPFIVVVGHQDSQGFFWTDYSRVEFNDGDKQ